MIEKELEPQYIYDCGFGPQVYHCTNCDGHRLTRILKGGFQPPDYKCEDCQSIFYAPKYTFLEVPEKAEPEKKSEDKYFDNFVSQLTDKELEALALCIKFEMMSRRM